MIFHMIFYMMPGGWGEFNSLQYVAHFGLGSNPPPPALKVNAAATKKFNCNLQRASLKETPAARYLLPRIHITCI